MTERKRTFVPDHHFEHAPGDPLPPSATYADMGDMAKAIAAAAHARYKRDVASYGHEGEPLDHTDEWLIDTGGIDGTPRKEDLMQDPPGSDENAEKQGDTLHTYRGGGKGRKQRSDSDLDDEWQSGLSDHVEPGSPMAINNIVQIAERTIDNDQRYFDQLQQAVEAGDLTRKEADARWRKRIGTPFGRKAS